MSKPLFAWILAGCLLGPLAAQEGEAGEVGVSELIEQLGDPSYKVRRDAEKSLRRLGDGALEALEIAAEDHDDSEVQWRARRLVRQIEHGDGIDDDGGLEERRGARRAHPRVRWAWPQQGQELDEAFEGLFERLERDFDMDIPRRRFFADDFFQDLEDQMDDMRSRMRGMSLQSFGTGAEGHSLQINIGPDGVSVEVTEQDEDGETETKTYEAPDLDTFREKYPDVAERYLDRGASPFRVQLGRPGLRMPRGFRELMVPGRTGVGVFELDDRPRLGVYVRETDDAGLEVERVVPGSLADRLGIEPDDVVLEVDGQAVSSPEDVREALEQAGDTVEVKVRRDGDTEVLEVERDRRRSGQLKPRKKKRVVVR